MVATISSIVPGRAATDITVSSEALTVSSLDIEVSAIGIQVSSVVITGEEV
jgi:hypothetical protein